MSGLGGVQEQSGILRVLVVDDNEVDFVLVRELLDEAAPRAFEFDWSASYDEGLSRLCEGFHDVCLMDHRLGSHTGTEAIQEARACGCTVPTILLTGMDSPEVDAAALRAGAADYLSKSELTSRDLLRTIRYAIERQRAEREVQRSQQFFQSTLNSLTAHIAVLDQKGEIVAVNTAWEEFARCNNGEFSLCGVGVNYLAICDAAGDFGDAAQVSRGIRQVLTGQRPEFTAEYPCATESGDTLWFRMNVRRLNWSGAPHVVVAHEDTSAIKNSLEAIIRSERQLAEAQSLAHIGSWDLDLRTYAVHWSDEMYRIFGLPEGSPISHAAVKSHIPEEDWKRIEEMSHNACSGEAKFDLQHLIRRADGAERIVHSQGEVMRDENGAPVRMFGMMQDITEQKEAEQALLKAEANYRGIFENAIEGVFQISRNGNFINANPALARIHGYDSPQELMAATGIIADLLVEPQDYYECLEDIHLHGIVTGKEFQVYKQDGSVTWVSLNLRSVRDDNGEILWYEGSLEDISRRKQAEQQLQINAFQDSLTQFPNRALFLNRLGHVLELAQRRGEYSFAVFYLDVDGFKHVNDSLGHVAGDQLLIELARRLDNCLRPGDTVARLSGDEFAVLLEDIKEVGDAIAIADEIQRQVSCALKLEDNEIFPTITIGIALGSPHYARAEEILRDADTAMYRAKSRGRGSYQIFDRSMHAHAVHRFRLEGELRRAIEGGETVPFYQPIIDLQTGTLWGFEALVRWNHPQRGLVAPNEFIPLAEETGLIIPLDEKIRELAALQVSEWRKRHSHGQHWMISVNVSRRAFSSSNLADSIKRVLDITGLPPSCLKVEITETAIVDNMMAAESSLKKIKEFGVHLSMDDFGTGYSSLSYLHRFPIDTLKIDRSFIQRIEEDSFEIVRAIVALAHSLEMGVIAEGVETAQQARLLQELHCEYAQGFLFSKPVPAHEIEKFLHPEQRWTW